MARLEVPDVGRVWMTAECRDALEAIDGYSVRKKRDTVVLLACQAAGIIDSPKTAVFKNERACSESVWYMKWQYIPEVQRALEVCTVAAQAWMDANMALNAQIATQKVQQQIVDNADAVVTALLAILRDTRVRADYRLETARAYLALLNPELAARIMPSVNSLAVEVTDQPEQVVRLDLSEADPDLLRAIVNESAGGGVATRSAGGVGHAGTG